MTKIKLHPDLLVVASAMIRYATFRRKQVELDDTISPKDAVMCFIAAELSLEAAFGLMSDFVDAGLLTEDEGKMMIGEAMKVVMAPGSTYTQETANTDIATIDRIGKELGLIPVPEKV